MRAFRLIVLQTAAALFSCAPGGSAQPECVGAKCDDPGSTADARCEESCAGDNACVAECREAAALEHCSARRADALDSSQRVFTDNAVRWACADVEGVMPEGGDVRGKEYCEYFAVAALPPDAAGSQVAVVDPGRVGGDPLAVELDDEQIFALEDEADAVVGQCVFTAWHADRREPLGVCSGAGTCPGLMLAPTGDPVSWMDDAGDYPMSEDHLRMKSGTNSNGAATSLVADCLQGTLAGDADDSADPLHDAFTRGCMKAFSLFGTEWRRSDSAICAASGRLAECGCAIDDDGDRAADLTDPRAISEALVGTQHRGFHLGGWASRDELPAGCRAVDTGDASEREVIVTCDLTAGDLLAGAADLQGFCRDRYAQNVVVYVDIEPEAVVCEPAADGPYADSCTAAPWAL